MVIILTKKKAELLKLMAKKGKITIKDQNIFSPLAFRINMALFENEGIVIRDGYNDRKIVWKITEKGMKLAKLGGELFEGI
jgi:predicted transcriptional regulator